MTTAEPVKVCAPRASHQHHRSVATGGCHNGDFGQSRAHVRSVIQALAGGAYVESSLVAAQDKGTDQLVAHNDHDNQIGTAHPP